MRKKSVISLFLAVLLLFALWVPAAASDWSDFTDVSGHWAEETLKKGFEDGAITGIDESSLRPNDPITAAQMLTILCRVLNVPTPSAAPAVAVSPDAWYYADAQKARALGLITGSETDLDTPMLRQDALAMLAKAFRLVPAAPDLSVISSMSDYGELREENRAAMAALCAEGYVKGYNGSLSVSSGITRAEFLSVLYRIAASSLSADALSSAACSAVVTGSGKLTALEYSQDLWLDCSLSSVSLDGVKAGSITVLNPRISDLTISGSSLDALALGSCDKSLQLTEDSSVGLLRADGTVRAQLGENVKSLELTGSGSELTLSGAHSVLAISGSGNTVTLDKDCALEKLIITGSENKVFFLGGSSAGAVTISGAGNALSPKDTEEHPAGGNALSSISLSGSKNEVSLKGSVSGSVSIDGERNVLIVTSGEPVKSAKVVGESNWLTLSCGDMASLEIGGNCSSVHKIGSGLVSSVLMNGANSVLTFYAGNTAAAVQLSGSGNAVTLDGSAKSVTIDGRGTRLTGSGSAASVVLNAFGCSVDVSCAALTDNSFEKSSAEVLAKVSSSYTGNFTLKWALEHDYTDLEKEIFVNAKGYTSKTKYLIWVNKAMQRVNIFESKNGSWSLIHSCIVGTGAMNSQTPVGVYDTTYKLEAGWTTSSYTCKPVVGFKSGSGYAFHSRLYYPRSSTLKDTSIGFPISHGCVRMYDEDVWYIYNNIPFGTTVVVF